MDGRARESGAIRPERTHAPAALMIVGTGGHLTIRRGPSPKGEPCPWTAGVSRCGTVEDVRSGPGRCCWRSPRRRSGWPGAEPQGPPQGGAGPGGRPGQGRPPGARATARTSGGAGPTRSSAGRISRSGPTTSSSGCSAPTRPRSPRSTIRRGRRQRPGRHADPRGQPSRKDFEEPVAELKGQGLAEHLQGEGYAVLSMDLRGQGQNPRRALTPERPAARWPRTSRPPTSSCSTATTGATQPGQARRDRRWARGPTSPPPGPTSPARPSRPRAGPAT